MTRYKGRLVDSMTREELLVVVEELGGRAYRLSVEKYDLERVLREVAGDQVADAVLLQDVKRVVRRWRKFKS